MKIEPNMPLGPLAALMGPSATTRDAREMRAMLVSAHPGRDTSDVGKHAWQRYLIRIAADRERSQVADTSRGKLLDAMLKQEMERTELCIELRTALADVLTIIERHGVPMSSNEALTVHNAKDLLK